MSLLKPNASSRLTEWLPVIILMLVAAAVRWHSNSDVSYLLSGGDGPYFPLQVRTLITDSRLAMPDMPLLFVVGALVAKVLQTFSFGNTDECVLMAVRLTDAFLPPLAAIPVFLFAKELNPSTGIGKILTYVMVGFAIINFTTTINFSYQLQKNGLGVQWIFWFLYFTYSFLKYEEKKDLYFAVFILVICALTHFGSFTLLILFSVLLGLIWSIQNRNRLPSIRFKTLLPVLLVLLLLFSIVAWFDGDRFQRLLFIPFRIFEFPVLWMLIDGQDIGMYFSPINTLVTNTLAIYGLILLLINRKKIEKPLFLFALTLVTFALTLVSPLLGLEWAHRLYIMSFLPLPFLYLILFQAVQSNWVKVFPALFFFGFMLICLNRGWVEKQILSISEDAFSEFKTIKYKVKFTPGDLFLGRQDLRLLGSWMYKTKGTADYLFTNQDFINYKAVYILKQIEGSNLPKARFREPEIPVGANLIFKGNFFELFQIDSTSGWKPGGGKPPRAQGEIIALSQTHMVLLNRKSGNKRTVDFSEDLVFEGLQPGNNLKKGMQVEVFGHWKVFSLHVAGEKVREVKKWE